MRAVGLLPLVVLTGCFVANPRWQGSGEDGADGTTGSPMDDDGPGTSLGTDSTAAATMMPAVDSGPLDDEGETMATSDWWDTAWHYRRRIEWLPVDIGGQVAGVPVQVEVTSLGLPDEFAGGGRDIRVVADTGEVLSVEVDHWSDGLDEGVVWFPMPDQNGTEPVLWLYYGNPNVDPEPLNSEVFTNGYIAVWHLQNDSDSTGKGHSIEVPRQMPAEGYIGNGLAVDAMVGGVPVNAGPALLALSSSDFTFSAMVNPGEVGEGGVLLEVVEADYPLVRVGLDGDAAVSVTRYVPGDFTPEYSALSEDTLLAGIWSHVIVRHSADVGTQIDIDGFATVVAEDTTGRLPVVPQGELIRIGGSIDGSAVFTGLLDEVRVADVFRDDAWVRLEYDAVEPGLAVLGVVEERP